MQLHIACALLLDKVVAVVSAAPRRRLSIFRDCRLSSQCGMTNTRRDAAGKKSAMTRRDVRVAFIRNVKATLARSFPLREIYFSKSHLEVERVLNVFRKEFTMILQEIFYEKSILIARFHESHFIDSKILILI